MMRREMVEGVRFDDFMTVAKRAGWDAQGLAEMFAGKIDKAGDLFKRIFAGNPHPNTGRCQWDTVIPYVSVITKYIEMRDMLAADGRLRLCSCGCKRPVGKGQSRAAHDRSDTALSGGSQALGSLTGPSDG